MIPLILLLLLVLVLVGFGFVMKILWIAAAVLLIVWLFGLARHSRGRSRSHGARR